MERHGRPWVLIEEGVNRIGEGCEGGQETTRAVLTARTLVRDSVCQGRAIEARDWGSSRQQTGSIRFSSF